MNVQVNGGEGAGPVEQPVVDMEDESEGSSEDEEEVQEVVEGVELQAEGEWGILYPE